MCVILQLKPDILPDFDKFQNAVWNNPHGYGIILKGNGKLKCIKKLTEEGSDPEEIYKLLEQHKKSERFVHLRWKTEGAISEENVQPFLAYKHGRKEVYFMHNGTLNGYAPGSPMAGGYNVKSWSHEEDQAFKDASDSRRFCEFKLIPLLKILVDSTTKGINLDDPMVCEILNKFWPVTGMNRGILITNDQEPFYFNMSDWKTIKVGQKEFLSSNDTYYDRLQRGYEYDRREEKKKEEQAERSKSNNNPDITTQSNLITYNSSMGNLFGHPVFDNKFKLKTENLEHIFEDWDLYEAQGYKNLSALSVIEITELVRKMKEIDLVTFIMMMTQIIGDSGETITKLTGKLERASRHHETLKFGILDDINGKVGEGFSLIDQEGNPLSSKIAKIDKKTRVVTIINSEKDEVKEHVEQAIG